MYVTRDLDLRYRDTDIGTQIQSHRLEFTGVDSQIRNQKKIEKIEKIGMQKPIADAMGFFLIFQLFV